MKLMNLQRMKEGGEMKLIEMKVIRKEKLLRSQYKGTHWIVLLIQMILHLLLMMVSILLLLLCKFLY